MANKFNQYFDKLTNETNRGEEFKKRIEELPGKNWKSEIASVSKEFGLNTSHVMEDIKGLLVQSLDGESLTGELNQEIDTFKSIYKVTKIGAFKESEEIAESLKSYIEKIKNNTEKRLASVLFRNPDAIKKFPRFMADNETTLDSSNVESTKSADETVGTQHQEPVMDESIQDNNQRFFYEIQEILAGASDNTNQTKAIKETYRKIYGKNFVLKTFYRLLGLKEEYIKRVDDVNMVLVADLIGLQKTPDDVEIQAIVDKFFAEDKDSKPDLEPNHGPKVVGYVDVSHERPRFGMPKGGTHPGASEKESMQAATTDPLDLVGKKMTMDAFLQACKLDYPEIIKHVKDEDPIPARYFSHNEKFISKTAERFEMHFFTIGQESRANGDTPLINVSVLVPKGTQFNDGEVYKITLKEISPEKADTKGQSRQVRGDLVRELDLPQNPAGNFIGLAKGAEMLKSIV